jgi:hypothetical protein
VVEAYDGELVTAAEENTEEAVEQGVEGEELVTAADEQTEEAEEKATAVEDEEEGEEGEEGEEDGEKQRDENIGGKKVASVVCICPQLFSTHCLPLVCSFGLIVNSRCTVYIFPNVEFFSYRS